jgi:hypothetical protein
MNLIMTYLALLINAFGIGIWTAILLQMIITATFSFWLTFVGVTIIFFCFFAAIRVAIV